MVIVLMASLIATVSTTAIALQAHTSYVNSRRQSMAKGAREAAESGLAIIIESLNQDYPEWLISNYEGTGTWKRRATEGTGCRAKISGQPSVSGISSQQSNGTQGIYRLKSYEFDGTSYYGGRGRLVVEGEIRSEGDRRLAAAQIIQEMTVIAKSCNSLPGSPDESESIWPGLFMQNIGDYDRTKVKLKGSNPPQAATILCTSNKEECRSSSRTWKSNYPPWEDVQFQPDITLPETPTPPTGLRASRIKPARCVAARGRKEQVDSVYRIPEDVPAVSKKQEADGTWHVHASDINMSGRSGCTTKLKISKGPIRLYVSGNVSLAPHGTLDTTEVSHAADFMLLGTKPRLSGRCRQRLNMKQPLGTQNKPAKAFIWMPSGCVKFQFTKTDPHYLEGAIWGQQYDATGAGSHEKNYVDISVPEGLPSLIFQRLGVSFGVGQREYVAQGVLSWRSHGR
mgnify:CR=1 FL=1